MLPAVAKVVVVLHPLARFLQILTYRHLAPGKHRGVVESVGVGYANRHGIPPLADAEGVQVRVLPAHGILDGHVEVPEVVLAGDLDLAPDGGLDVAELYPEPEDGWFGLHVFLYRPSTTSIA